MFMYTIRNASLFVVILISGFAHSKIQAKSYDVTQLPIVVRNMAEWSNEYPTVINNWEGMFVKSVNGELPPLLSVVISINGKDAKGMSEEKFNDLLMSQGKSTIEYLVKKNGVNEKKQCTIFYYPSIYWPEEITMSDPDVFPDDIEVKNIKNASVFSKNTYYYKVGELQDIDEAAVLEAAGKSLTRLGFAKVEDKNTADMILTLSKGRDKNNGHKLTLCIFDGKSLQSGIERALWTLDIIDLKPNFKSQESAIKTSINKMSNNFPFDMPTYSQNVNMLGIAFENAQSVSSGKTLKVLKGSDAYEKGLRDGDAIIGAYAGCTWVLNILYVKTRRYYFKPYRQNQQKNWGVDVFTILPIIPQYTSNHADHYLTEYPSVGGSNSRLHFKVKKNYGEKLTMNAPFEMRNFNFKYIR